MQHPRIEPCSRRAFLRTSLGLAAALPLSASLHGCAPSSATMGSANKGAVVLSLFASMLDDPTSPHMVWCEKFLQLLDSETNGRITIQVLPSKQDEMDVV